jgi:hypothetical protein
MFIAGGESWCIMSGLCASLCAQKQAPLAAERDGQQVNNTSFQLPRNHLVPGEFSK